MIQYSPSLAVGISLKISAQLVAGLSFAPLLAITFIVIVHTVSSLLFFISRLINPLASGVPLALNIIGFVPAEAFPLAVSVIPDPLADRVYGPA
ncbi:hypothetical protein D3C87_1549500 [compost metagenome]